MIVKKDYLLAIAAGFFTGVLVIPILIYSGLFKMYHSILIIGLPILWVAILWLSSMLSQHISPIFTQLGKYAVAGFLSAAIDLSIISTISYYTHITAGLSVGWINIPGFVIATLNAYLWNRLWVFNTKIPGEETQLGIFNNLPKFLLVVTIGLILNSVIVVLLTTYVPTPQFFTPIYLLNFTKIIAAVVVITWNFLGYKYMVFNMHRVY
jgi:putative flippase GtrA